MRSICCAVALLTCSAVPAPAAFEFSPNCKMAYREIIALRFDEGRTLIAAERKARPGNKLVHLLENYIDFLTVIISEEEERFRELSGNKDRRLAEIGEGDQASPYYLYCKAEIHMQWAFARLKFNEYVTAAYEIHKAYRMLEKNSRLFPSFVPNRKGMGLLHVLVGTIPDEYAWARNIAGMQGSVEQGMGELAGVLDVAAGDSAYRYLATETFFLLAFVQVNLQLEGESDHPAFARHAGTLFTAPEDRSNILYRYACARIAMQEGRNDEAMRHLGTENGPPSVFPFHYLDYLRGCVLQSRLDAGAEKYFRRFLENFGGRNYIKAAWQRIGWTHLLEGDTVAYRRILAQALKGGDDYVGADRIAERDAKGTDIPNVRLLRARLLFDGGYYARALAELVDEGDASAYRTRAERLEFIYRLARVHHKLGNRGKAESYYGMTLEQGEKLPLYYAANSALQLGLLHERDGDAEGARKYFEKCLSLRDHEYSRSLSQKAKAGLSRLADAQ